MSRIRVGQCDALPGQQAGKSSLRKNAYSRSRSVVSGSSRCSSSVDKARMAHHQAAVRHSVDEAAEKTQRNPSGHGTS